MSADFENNQLESFGDLLMSSKKYQFTEEELTFEYDSLLKAGILELEDKKIKILNHIPVVDVLLPNFKTLFSFEFSDDPAPLKDFLKQVESYFPDGVLIGRTAFYSAFFRRCLILFVKENGHLLQLAKLHTKADREIFRFQHGLSEALTDLDMTPKAVVELISWLYSEVKSDDPNVVDTNVIDLANSLRKLCDSKPEIASALYGLIVLAEPVVLKSFHALILTSNYNHDPAFMAEMIALSSKEIYQATVVNSLINIDHKPGTPVQELIDVVENISDYNDDCLKELPIFYATMLKKVQPADTAQIQHCLDKLACLMENYPDLLGNVLFQMRFLTKYKEQVTEKIMRYIDSHELPEHFCGMVADDLKWAI
jgi:hypothetical protein